MHNFRVGLRITPKFGNGSSEAVDVVRSDKGNRLVKASSLSLLATPLKFLPKIAKSGETLIYRLVCSVCRDE